MLLLRKIHCLGADVTVVLRLLGGRIACHLGGLHLVSTLGLRRLERVRVARLQRRSLLGQRANVSVGDAQGEGVGAALRAKLARAHRAARDAGGQVLLDVLLVGQPDLVHHIAGVRIHVVVDQIRRAGGARCQVRVDGAGNVGVVGFAE